MHSQRSMERSNLDVQGSARSNEIPIECGSKTPQSRSISGLRNFLAGGVGGAFGITLGHPWDTIKVRLQTAPVPKPGEQPLFKGTLDCALKTLRNEGVVGLFKGLFTPVALSTPLCALQFLAVTMGRRLQMADPYGIPTNLQNFNAGMFAGACGAILVVPCDRIKCLLQVQQSFGVEKRYKGPLDCADKLYREGGIRSLYRGTCVTLLRELPGMGIYFLSYEWILDKLTLQGESRKNLNPLRVIIAGGTTGMICWFSILPSDVLKSRVQIAPEGTYPKGTRDALRKLVKEERITSLYKGLTPVMIRAFVGNAGVFLGFEVTLKLFNWILPE